MPFALFILDQEVNLEYVNRSLERAHYKAGYKLWVATDNYDDLPAIAEAHKLSPPDATVPPLPKDFLLPWIRKAVEDCARWLQKMPPEAPNGRDLITETGVTDEYFTCIDRFSGKDDIIVLCRVTESDGNLKVDYFPQGIDEFRYQLYTNDNFDEKAKSHQKGVPRQGKPDQIRAGSYYLDTGNSSSGNARKEYGHFGASRAAGSFEPIDCSRSRTSDLLCCFRGSAWNANAKMIQLIIQNE